MKKEIEVVAAVIEKDNKIFCAQRPNFGEVALKWEFPGGKVEKGETSEEALKREIREELASEIAIKDYITTINYEYQSFILIMHVYKCELVTGNLDIREHVNSIWIDKQDLNILDWAPADLKLLKFIR